MLGQELRDPLGIEHGGTLKGLGLLPLVTTFSAQKTRTQVSGRTGDLAATALPQLSHRAFSGYEIHMGQTEPCGSSGLCESHRPNKANNSNAFPFSVIERRNGEVCAEQQGFCCGNVFGTYIHGIFDQPQMAQGLIEALCLRKGLDPEKIAAVDFAQHKEEQYNLLAQGVRESLDMDAIYRILKEGI